MAKTDYRSVDEYIAAQPEAGRPVLQQVRVAIAAALPDAQEAISYQIPTYRVAGRAAVYFAGWKRHISLYPASERVVQAFRTELAPYEVENGTIRFPLESPPLDLIAAIAALMADQAQERTAAKRRPA